MKAHKGSRSIPPLILNLHARWRQVVNFMLQILYLRESTLVPIEYEAGWTLELAWAFLNKRKHLLPSTRI